MIVVNFKTECRTNLHIFNKIKFLFDKEHTEIPIETHQINLPHYFRYPNKITSKQERLFYQIDYLRPYHLCNVQQNRLRDKNKDTCY